MEEDWKLPLQSPINTNTLIMLEDKCPAQNYVEQRLHDCTQQAWWLRELYPNQFLIQQMEMTIS